MAQAEELRGKAAQETHSQVLPPLSHPPPLPQLYSLLTAFMEVEIAASQAAMKMLHCLRHGNQLEGLNSKDIQYPIFGLNCNATAASPSRVCH